MTTWPVLTRYDAGHLERISLPVGGIGTGTVGVGGRGDLRDWEITNRSGKRFRPANSFFALRVAAPHQPPQARVLEGPIPLSEYEGAHGSPTAQHGLPRFRHARFEAAYPLGQVHLSDPDVPVTVCLQTFNPLVPTDADTSGLPIAVLRYQFTNSSETTLELSVCGSLQNFIGRDASGGEAVGNSNTFRRENGFSGVFFQSGGVSPCAERWGTLALAVLNEPDVTYRTAWATRSWGDSLLDFWDDFCADGQLENRDADNENQPVGSLAVSTTLKPGETGAVTFLLAWHFPNRMVWNLAPDADSCCAPGSDDCATNPNWVGNYYATRFRDAWDVVRQIAPRLPGYETRTLAFVNAFVPSDLPDVVKEAALYNLSTLRSQTVFRTAGGDFFGWEGCHDAGGCCHGTCTHVWNYEQATAFLFGELARNVRETEFLFATDERGFMPFRLGLPRETQDWKTAAADGQMGCLMKLHRDWRLSGDDAFLRRLWPKAKKALQFAWITGGWDADQDGVMEGCQHNTMDVEYYGPNPQMGTWYLGALRAGEGMARYLGEHEFADHCRGLFESGSQWLDNNIFNGEYYEHQILPPQSADSIAPGLRHESMGAKDLEHPELQLGAGCLVDQLVGQYFAHLTDLGYLLRPENVKTTLLSIVKYNFRDSFWDHFNPMRSYVLGDESALLMASYPKGRRPERPFPYASEVMTGFEYTAAIGLLQAGMTDEALTVIQAIRARYDGAKRSPFDEAECGHHYARAMASWAAVIVMSGFDYDGTTQTMTFADPGDDEKTWFWSSGDAWGVARVRNDGVSLTRHGGSVVVQRVVLRGIGSVPVEVHDHRVNEAAA